MQSKASTGKMLAWAYGAVLAVAAAVFFGGVFLERQSDRQNHLEK